MSDIERTLDPRARPRVMTLEDARTELSNRVYAATELFEQLEGAGIIEGNGHHMRQEMARRAVDMLVGSWRGPRTDS